MAFYPYRRSSSCQPVVYIFALLPLRHLRRFSRYIFLGGRHRWLYEYSRRPRFLLILRLLQRCLMPTVQSPHMTSLFLHHQKDHKASQLHETYEPFYLHPGDKNIHKPPYCQLKQPLFFYCADQPLCHYLRRHPRYHILATRPYNQRFGPTRVLPSPWNN